MCNTKKIYGVLLIIVLLVSKVFAVENYNTADFVNDKITLTKMTFKDEIEKDVEEMSYYEFIKVSIPSKFVKPFYDFTYKNKNLGIELLGTAKHESGWKVFEGKLNDNGTRDYGPLMLNSGNIENEVFMNSFASNCQQYKNDRDIYYMCICINFYKSIRAGYGPWVTLQIYNGGWRTIRKNCPIALKRKVTKYANIVYTYINEYNSSYKDFKIAHREEYINHVAYSYIGKLYFYVAEMILDDIAAGSVRLDLCSFYPNLSDLLQNNVYMYDREFYEMYVLYTWVPKNIFSTPDFYLEDDEEYFKMLC